MDVKTLWNLIQAEIEKQSDEKDHHKEMTTKYIRESDPNGVEHHMRCEMRCNRTIQRLETALEVIDDMLILADKD